MMVAVKISRTKNCEKLFVVINIKYGKWNKKLNVKDEIIVNKIYYIRKQKIMLDRDLAELYGVQAIRLREQVKEI